MIIQTNVCAWDDSDKHGKVCAESYLFVCASLLVRCFNVRCKVFTAETEYPLP